MVEWISLLSIHDNLSGARAASALRALDRPLPAAAVPSEGGSESADGKLLPGGERVAALREEEETVLFTPLPFPLPLSLCLSLSQMTSEPYVVQIGSRYAQNMPLLADAAREARTAARARGESQIGQTV